MHNETKTDLILEGEAGIYHRVNLESGCGDTSSLIPFDSDLNSRGFKIVGDMICSSLAHGILRCYINPDEGTRALLLIGVRENKLNVFGLFFDATFADGAILTTTTSAAAKDIPTKGVHRRIYAWKSVDDLHVKHQSHLRELKAEHGEVQPAGNTLFSFAASMDSFTVRMNS